MKLLIPLLMVFLVPRLTVAMVLTDDTIWKNEILLQSDVLVPNGVTLTIEPGTVVRVRPSESTKTDPEYLSPLTEITVRGTLVVDGSASSPVVFLSEAKGNTVGWAGILIDQGHARLNFCRIIGAETGVSVVNGILEMWHCLLTQNRYGLLVLGESDVRVKSGAVAANDYGIVFETGAKVFMPSTVIRNNWKKNQHQIAVPNTHSLKDEPLAQRDEHSVKRIIGDTVAVGETVWSGRILIDGVVRVPNNSRLIILPGCQIEFRKKDTNHDGIGENGLLLQGVLIAKGTKDNPIIFRSAEKTKRPGDWDAINIMGSDGTLNLIEYCQIENAYRGLHFHFSNVLVQGSMFKNNYRAIQFQESNVTLRGNVISGNRSGLQARDSKVLFFQNFVIGNYTGMNLFRVALEAQDNIFQVNLREGVRLREGSPVFKNNVVYGNRYGVMIMDALFGNIIGNVISDNGEHGLSIKNTDNVKIVGNFVSANGLSGMNIKDARLLVEKNHISKNGVRGIGILGFDGAIYENSFVGNQQYAIDMEGNTDVDARNNWWSELGPEKSIWDKHDDPSLGLVRYQGKSETAYRFSWPVNILAGDTAWSGRVAIGQTVTVPLGVTLTVEPGTEVAFAKGAGLIVRGRIVAVGEEGREILFTSVENTGPGDWNEIRLERAVGSIFSYCRIQNATWGIHSHFTDLKISHVRFTNNEGGIKFRSGPLRIDDSVFDGNRVGIRAYRGIGFISGNTIRNNETGVFIREKAGGLTIRRNNFYDNRYLNIRLGDFNKEDVDASENWWGTTDPLLGIFDGRQESGIGKVLYKPFLKQKVREPQ